MDYNTSLALSFKNTNYRILAEFWRQSHIELLLQNLKHYRKLQKKGRWEKTEKLVKEIEKEVERKVAEKIAQSSLLKPSAKQEIMNVSSIIGLQILEWIKHYEYFSFYKPRAASVLQKRINILEHMHWKDEGTVDEEKTARALVNNKNFNIIERYRLACVYCFEDSIHVLWTQLSNKRFYSDLRSQPKLIAFWTYLMEGEKANLNREISSYYPGSSSNEYGFRRAVILGDRVAVEHFWNKLTSKEKEINLVEYAIVAAEKRHSGGAHDRPDFPRECYTDVLIFLLSKMNDEQRVRVFRNNGDSDALACFLDFPYQSSFINTAKPTLSFLQEKGYCSLLLRIENKIKSNFRVYQPLLKDFWQISSDSYKKFAINDHWRGRSLLETLFKFEDIKNIELILNDVSAVDREKIIFSSEGEDICKSLIYKNKWELLEMFITQCVPSKGTMIKFKEEFYKHTLYHHSKEESKDKWNKSFQLLDNFIELFENKKRKIEKDESTEHAKKSKVDCIEVTSFKGGLQHC